MQSINHGILIMKNESYTENKVSITEIIRGKYPSRWEDLIGKFKHSLTDEEKAQFSEFLKVGGGANDAINNLGVMPIDSILSPNEKIIFENITKTKVSSTKSISSSLIVILKATRLCNLRCTYCRSWAEGPGQVMSFKVLATAMKEIFSLPNIKNVNIVWHGGEVTLLNPKFFIKMMWMQEQFRAFDQKVENGLQTNAVGLSDEWVGFIKAYNVGVGVSLDGPPEINDTRRVDKEGKPTSNRVLDGVMKLNNAGIRTGALVVVDREVQKLGAKRLVEYMLGTGLHGIDLLNVLPENNVDSSKVVGKYLPYPEFVQFLIEVFDEWWPNYRDAFRVTGLQHLVDRVKRQKNDFNCLFEGDCMGKYVTIEANGDIGACDKYIGHPNYIFGNILEAPLGDILQDSKNVQYFRNEMLDVPNKMGGCEYFGICKGGCIHDRLLNSRFVKNYDGTCCGLSSLLKHIEGKLINH